METKENNPFGEGRIMNSVCNAWFESPVGFTSVHQAVGVFSWREHSEFMSQQCTGYKVTHENR